MQNNLVEAALATKVRLTATPENESFVSIIIATRNRGKLIAATVQSILANDYPNFEVIVVDQSDNQETAQALTQFENDTRVRYIFSQRTGTSYARNLGIAESQGALIAITDDDCEVAPDWLAQLVEAFEFDQKIGVIFGSVLPPADWNWSEGFIPISVLETTELQRNLWEIRKSKKLGACMGIRREVWQQVHGFDEMLGPGKNLRANEDGDIAFRAVLHGYYVLNTSNFKVTHFGARRNSEIRDLLFGYAFGNAATLLKLVRCRQLKVWPLLLDKMFLTYLFPVTWNIVRRKRPSGLAMLQGFLAGLWYSRKLPLDREHWVYQNQD